MNITFLGATGTVTDFKRLLNGKQKQMAESIKIHGQYVPVNADVELVSNLSAHADFSEIIN